jgi:hypothetical protein
MTISTPEDFRRIGRQEGRALVEGHSTAYMMFDPPNGPEHVAYLEGVVASLTEAVAAADEENLALTLTREVEPKEVSYLVFGTGALSYPWWGRVEWGTTMDGEDFPIDHTSDLDVAEPGDYYIIRHDTKEDPEGSMKGRTRLTAQQIVNAAAEAIRLGLIYDTDAQQDLGMCDSEQADAVLQIAVFGEAVFG